MFDRLVQNLDVLHHFLSQGNANWALHYKKMSGHCCDRTVKTKRQQQLAPMLIVSSKQDSTYFSSVKLRLSQFFLTQSGLRCLPICQDQMTQHHFETRTEPQPLPVYQTWKWDKSMQGFHLKRNLLKGSTTVSRKSTAVRQLLPSFPPMRSKMTKAADLKPRQIVLLQWNTVTRHN